MALAGSEDPVQAIQCSYPISFRHSRVVEGGVDEVVQGIGFTFLVHDGLADVHNLGRLVTKAVNPQDLPGFPVEQNLQHTYSFTGNLRPRQILEESLANIVDRK